MQTFEGGSKATSAHCSFKKKGWRYKAVIVLHLLDMQTSKCIVIIAIIAATFTARS